MADDINKNTPATVGATQEKTARIQDKIGKIVLEVVIIVFSIMVSLWLDNWNDKRKEREEVKEFLADLREDLKMDTATMRGEIDKLTPYIKEYIFAKNLTTKEIDSLKNIKATVKLNFDITPLQFNEGNYQGFKSSGKIGFIDNKNLKKRILAYHEQVIPGLKDVENEHSAYQKALRNTFFSGVYSEKSAKATFLDPKIKADLNSAELFSNFMIGMCQISIQQADSLLLDINKELK